MKTKYYLVSRPELTRLSDKIIDNAKRGYPATGHVQIFLKSKTPVEEIGTGEIGETKSSALKSMEVVGIGIDTPNYVCIKNVELPKLTTKNIGKKVKIYIEVIKWRYKVPMGEQNIYIYLLEIIQMPDLNIHVI